MNMKTDAVHSESQVAVEQKTDGGGVPVDGALEAGVRRKVLHIGRYMVTLVWHPLGWGREDAGEGGVLRTRTFFEVAGMSLGLNTALRIILGKLSVTVGW